MSIKSDRWIRRMATEPRHDRALRAGPGARRRRPAHRFVRHLELRLRRALRERVQDLHEHQLDDRRSEGFRSRIASSISTATVCIIPPNSFALARTVEYFRIPRNVLTICLGKSTYARCGIIVNVTPLEPEWEGHVTLEFSNTTTAAREDLCERGRGADAVLRVGRSLRDVLQGSRRQVPGPAAASLCRRRERPRRTGPVGRLQLHRARICTSGLPLRYWMACTGT